MFVMSRLYTKTQAYLEKGCLVPSSCGRSCEDIIAPILFIINNFLIIRFTHGTKP